MNVREMEARDISRCLWVRSQTRENRMTPEALERAGINAQSVAERLATTHRGWVCEVEGEVAGFSRGDASSGELWVVAVLPEFEGRGIGRALVERTQDWLNASGWEEIWLWTSPDPSTRAYALYGKLGWRDCGIVRGQRLMKR